MKCLTNLFFLSFLFLISCESNPYIGSTITMEKTPCFGSCPDYDITIGGNGVAVFKGRENAPRKGTFTKQLTPENTKILFDAFANGNFFSFEEEYTSEISDLPTTFLSFDFNSKIKKIKDYYGAPDALKKLEKLVEEIANSDAWEQSE